MSQHIEQPQSRLSLLFSRFIAEKANQSLNSVLARTAAWLSEVQQNGDVCLDLALYTGKPWPDQKGMNRSDLTPDLDVWCRELMRDGICVGGPGEHTPMILDGHRLYLNRFWRYEDTVAGAIKSRLQTHVHVEHEALKKGLVRLFGDDREAGVNWQKLAAALAVTRHFSVISGGPGTGKTSSLVKVLALLLEQHPGMYIRMAAPTGKAAARMMESIRQAKSKLDIDDAIRAAIPDEASTLHRLLGYSPAGYRHHSMNPLILDCLVIDEASMVDLPMMARLLDALPQTAQLILLGDRDQLASVDAGNVLGDLTGHGHEIEYRPETAELLASLTGVNMGLLPVNPDAPVVADAIALLRKSYRFDENSGIGNLARHINSGAADQTIAWLSDHSCAELSWAPDLVLNTLLEQIADSYMPYLLEQDIAQALDLFEKQRVLCAVRQGPYGMESVNREIARRLIARGLLLHGEAVAGMPVMITGNNYELNLFNGDVGLLWRNQDGQLRAYFRAGDNALRDISVQSLPQYELSWAMTVHKSQGSEFERVVAILPDIEAGRAVLTRELLYTAVTRAKNHFTLFAGSEAVRWAVIQTVNRSTGLADRLNWSGGDTITLQPDQ
ncbi:exodeoxyribonuclease V subunit alpha [Mariprofundus erugo]|uniref:exodeoxyribonuclease V subunit alpha n=1 Tax=Mariprofundus erugo TaxID=2528639 RepID=UPI0010FCF583|nr:exodeoxyribonuclease V subunit alpha [Mariprofundus erugo]TLS75962.1 exodeoxyribonuclease V subunit alpha [Mariprofundus erugo]